MPGGGSVQGETVARNWPGQVVSCWVDMRTLRTTTGSRESLRQYYILCFSTPGATRTLNLLLRRQLLCPLELRGHAVL